MTIYTFTGAFLLLFYAVAPVPATRKDRSVEMTLKRQADAWDRAIVGKNRRAIEDNISTDFMQIGSDGAQADKLTFVAALLDERLTIAPYAVEDVQIRIYQNTALRTGTTDMHGSWDGKAFSNHYRFTDVYVREHGKWRVVNVQTTPIK